MITILVSYSFFNDRPWDKIPPDPNIRWFFNEEVEAVDIWIVHEDLHLQVRQKVRARAVILITGEPPMQRRYPAGYWRQFDLVVTSHAPVGGVPVLNWQQCYPWHVGWMKRGALSAGVNPASSYKSLVESEAPKKKKLVSVVCSADSRLPGHQKRLRFVRRLKAVLGDRLDWFGRGIMPIGDKWDVMADYHYHISLENSCVPHYWTEKIADAFLAECFPIYWGAPNVDLYFDPHGYEIIDVNKIEESCERVVKLIQRIPSDSMLSAVRLNKSRVLEDYNYHGLVRQVALNYLARPLRDFEISSLRNYAGRVWTMMERGGRLSSRLRYVLIKR